jgi:poly(hydroxyalkanoate) depolymerase family esterase
MRAGRTVGALVCAVAVALAGVLLPATSSRAASLREVTGFGTNPSQLRMFLYVPARLMPEPAIVVAVHYCHGDAQAFYNGSEFARLADQHGFIVVFPSVTQASDGCFDVASSATLTHDGGGDSRGIVSMVEYVLQNHDADPEQVYVTGVSSGAMMTNVLLGAYPDVFRAGSAFAGVPFGCFAGSTSWNTECATGEIDRTAEQWGDLVRDAYPGYSGPRPRVQLWHGSDDEVLSSLNLAEAVEQWTDVLGVDRAPTTTEQDTPRPGWTRTRYADAAGTVLVEAVSMADTPHNLPVQAADAIRFFGLDDDVPASTASGTLAAGATGCAAEVVIGSAWNGGFVATVTVTAGGSAVSPWTVTMDLGEGIEITSLWGARSTGTSGSVTVTGARAGADPPLAAGQSTQFGFQATGPSDEPALTCAAG